MLKGKVYKGDKFTNFMKQIKVQDDVWEKLSRKKLDLKCKSLNDVVSKLFKLVSKFKLNEELRSLG